MNKTIKKEEVKMKDYSVELIYKSSMRISLPVGTDIDLIDKKIGLLPTDENFQETDCEFVEMIKQNGGNIHTWYWDWDTNYLGIKELREDEYQKNYKKK